MRRPVFIGDFARLKGDREFWTRTRWRRERDSNPRYGFPHTHFPGVRLQPLGHPSAVRIRAPDARLNLPTMRISAKGAHYSAANRPRKQAPVQVQGNRISRQGWELCQYASSQPAFLSCLARTLFHRPFARHSARCVRAVSQSASVLIVVHDDIEPPMQPVFHAAMRARNFVEALGPASTTGLAVVVWLAGSSRNRATS